MNAKDLTGSQSADGSGESPLTLGSCLWRVAGLLLWRLAEADSLPVPDATRDLSSGIQRVAPGALRRARFIRILGHLALLGGVLAVVVGGVAWWQLREVHRLYLRNPPGASLLDTAAQLRAYGEGAWWLLFYPGTSARLGHLADAIEAGRDDLLFASETYRTCSSRLNAMGAPGRILEGLDLAAPLRAALGAVRSPWHQETATYQHMYQALLPYQRLSIGHDVRVGGRVVSLAPGHALRLEILDAAGGRLGDPSPTLHVGDSFELRIVAGGKVILSDLARPESGGVYEVLEDIHLPLTEWSNQPTHLSEGGAIQVKFDQQTGQLAPLLPSMNSVAMMELDIPTDSAD